MIILLDSFQGDVFQEIINDSSYYEDIFKGFTYFRNALGGYPYTSASVPLILSGRFYENSVPIRGFVENVLSSESVPVILKDKGYRVDLITHGKHIIADKNVASTHVEMKQLVEKNVKLREAAFIFDVTLFRYLPHFAKRYVFNNQSWFFVNMGLSKAFGEFPAGDHRDSIEFARKMTRRAHVGSDRGTFKYFHFMTSHLPIRADERLKYVELEPTRKNYIRQAKGSLELVKMLFGALKRIGVYENTMIVVLADTGADFEVNTEVAGYTGSSNYRFPEIDKIKGRALPIFLVKPFKSTGKLNVSDAPVSLADVAKTIMVGLDMESEIPGTSVFEIKDTDNRPRRFLDHTWGWSRVGKSYLPPMNEYIVSGFSWLDESWHLTNRVFAPEGVLSAPAQSLKSGLIIEFGENGNRLPYQGRGWSFAEGEYTWTDRKTASLIIPIEKPESDVRLTAKFSPFIVPGRLQGQKVDVIVNGRNVGHWTIPDQGANIENYPQSDRLEERTILIPKRFLKDSSMMITFSLPYAISPRNLGIGKDSRTLGLAMRSIVLAESEPAQKME